MNCFHRFGTAGQQFTERSPMDASERLMIEKARAIYGVPDDYWNSQFDPALFRTAMQQMAKVRANGFFPADFWTRGIAEFGQRKGGITTVRPVWDGNGGNVLGRVWDTVLQVAARSDAEGVDRIAVGMIPQLGLGARAFESEAGARAILIDNGLFHELYHLDHALMILLKPESVSGQRRQTAARVLSKHLHTLSGASTEFEDHLDYESQEEFVFVDRMADAQRQFILLHEVAHFALSHLRRDSRLPTTEKERSADLWAVRLLLEKGRRFHRPFFQFAGLQWLLEFLSITEGGRGEFRACDRLNEILKLVSRSVPSTEWKPDNRIHSILSNI
jgi:hypothetical protein